MDKINDALTLIQRKIQVTTYQLVQKDMSYIYILNKNIPYNKKGNINTCIFS